LCQCVSWRLQIHESAGQNPVFLAPPQSICYKQSFFGVKKPAQGGLIECLDVRCCDWSAPAAASVFTLLVLSQLRARLSCRNLRVGLKVFWETAIPRHAHIDLMLVQVKRTRTNAVGSSQLFDYFGINAGDVTGAIVGMGHCLIAVDAATQRNQKPYGDSAHFLIASGNALRVFTHGAHTWCPQNFCAPADGAGLSQ
jgi:hypothetical protein